MEASEEQRQALTQLATELFAAGFGVGLVFVAGFCGLIGVLIVRSRMLPHLIGYTLIVAGACYATNSLAAIVAPDVADALFPWILVPPLLGELSLALWLLIRGANGLRSSQ